MIIKKMSSREYSVKDNTEEATGTKLMSRRVKPEYILAFAQPNSSTISKRPD